MKKIKLSGKLKLNKASVASLSKEEMGNIKGKGPDTTKASGGLDTGLSPCLDNATFCCGAGTEDCCTF